MPDFIRASDLYELATCEHRIALDRALPRERRRPPDEATALLLERGRALEAEVAAALGYPQPEYEPPDFARGAEATLELMRSGARGIYQGVLVDGDRLAIPDLLERAEGDAPRLGTPWHYLPGDVKAGLSPRTDQVLQVAFAGALLEAVQGRRPNEGFLVLGDRSREVFALDAFARAFDAALARVVAIVAGHEATDAFYDHACARCRYGDECVPALVARHDLSLVDGMTPTRRRVLRRAGIVTFDDLAAVDRAAWRASGRPTLGLEALVPQAQALAAGVPQRPEIVEIPARGAHDLLVHLERDPLHDEAVILLAWARASDPGSAAVRVTLDAEARRDAFRELYREAHAEDARVYHYGSAVPRGFATLAIEGGLGPDAQVGLEKRLVDLHDVLRRGTAFLPVYRYGLNEVVAALHPEPGTGCTDTSDTASEQPVPGFVYAAHLRSGADGPWAAGIDAAGRRALAWLVRLDAWLRSHPVRPPRGGR